MRAAAWLVSLFAAAALGARKMAPQGMSLLSRAPVHETDHTARLEEAQRDLERLYQDIGRRESRS